MADKVLKMRVERSNAHARQYALLTVEQRQTIAKLLNRAVSENRRLSDDDKEVIGALYHNARIKTGSG